MRSILWSGVGLATLLAGACTTFGTELATAPDAGGAARAATDDASPSDASGADAAPSADGDAGRAPCAGEADCERYVFVSSERYAGEDIGAAIGADGRCTNLAALPDTLPVLRGRQWLAWISDDSASFTASARLTHGTRPYRLANQKLVANDWAQLTSSALANAIDFTERGQTVGQEFVWTGTGSTGVATANTCTSWSINGAGNTGSVGLASAFNSTWTNSGTAPCVEAHRLYCFEK